MRFYFKRKREGKISTLELYSYESLIAGLVSLIYLFMLDNERLLSYAKIITGLLMGICSVSTAIVIFREYKKDHVCNTYDLLRCFISGVICTVALTCIDYILK